MNIPFSEKTKLVIFDRDGVINLVPQNNSRYISHVEELVLRNDVLHALVELQNAKIFVCVATNQQGIATGQVERGNLLDIHDSINHSIKLIGGESIVFFICDHLATEGCDCRKPKPGLLIQAMKYFNVLEENTIFIGDQGTDKLAAKNARITYLDVDSCLENN